MEGVKRYKLDINSYVDSNVDCEITSSILPSEKLIISSLENNDFHALSNIVIIPSTELKKAILFSDDIWTNKEFINEGEIYRKANFKNIPEKMKLEIKIIGLYLFWFSVKKAKVSSIIRIIENLIVISKTLSNINVESIFWLDRDPIRNKFISEFSSKRSSGTLDNYYKSLARICDMQHTLFGEYGFYLKTNFMKMSPQREVNQTYCMPIRILLSYWKSYIEYFNNLKIDQKNWTYITSLPYEYRKYLKNNNLNHHNSYWLCYIYEFCQKNLDEIFKSEHCEIRNLIMKRSDADIKAYNDRTYTYLKNIDGNLEEVALACYNRRYPQYLVDMEDIYCFYNRVSLIACDAIQSMTGMRKSEALSIKFNSLIEDKDWVGVRSTLYKYADDGGVQEVWAAAPYVKEIFKKISLLAAPIFRVSENELQSLYIKTNAREFHSSGRYSLMKNQRTSERQLNWSEKNDIYISESDLVEFWQLNPNISDKERVKKHIYIGAKWPIESHQFRRSIAVHVRRLELVTMNQLVSHLKQLAKTIAEWYADGAVANSSFKGRIAESFAKELERADLERAATIAMKFQNGNNLYGKGGEHLESQKGSNINMKTYQSFQHALSLAKRRKSKIMSLGNGMYCMNGAECDFKAIVQSATCRPDCENLVADEDSIPIWLNRYNKLRLLYSRALKENQPIASQEFLRLEMESYKQALEFYGVIL